MDMQDVPNTSHVLANLIQATLNPLSPQPLRLEALEKIEDFKNNSPLCAQCGLFLVRCNDYSHIVRHTGIQLMEHCIKYRWYVISQEEKVFIKESCIALLAADGSDIIPLLHAHRHTLDAISRIFVEMIKREWPQQWPNMFQEFSAICALGTVQTELILLVFLRLSEDVVSLQTLDSQARRRDLCQQLNSSMKEILGFFQSTLEKHVGGGGDHDDLVSIALTTLSEYLEWIPPSNLFDSETLMIQLYSLVPNERFQTQVAECLEKVASRRGKQEEKINLFRLLSCPELWNNIHGTVLLYQSKGAASKSVIDFYKPLSGFLRNYLSLFAPLFSSSDTSSISSIPANFSPMIEVLILLLHTKSLLVLDNVYTGVATLFRHPELSKCPELVVALEKYILVTCSLNLIRKKSGPVLSNGVVYSEDDYMDDTDYRRHFVKIKTLINQNFRELTKIVPDLLFVYAEQWLMRSISNNLSDSSEWEALCGYLDSFIEKIIVPKYLPSALSLMNLLLGFSTEDAGSYSAALSCLSSLFCYLTICDEEHRNQYLPKILDKIFTLLLFSPPSGSDNELPTRLKAVKLLRKHAGGLIVKLSQRYPSLLSPFFDTILNVLLSCSSQLTQLQINCLHEALITINNHSGSFAKQSEFVRSLLDVNGAAAMWTRLTNDVFAVPTSFIQFVGLHLSASQEDPTIVSNRIQIMHCANLITAILRRCRPPKSKEGLKRGGYLNEDKVVSPMTSHVLPLIPGILKLVHMMAQLHNPEFHGKGQGSKSGLIHEDMLPALDIDESEKKNLLGEQYFGNNPPNREEDPDLIQNKSSVSHMQVFINNLFENLYIILGFLARTMAAEVYSIPEFSRAIHENLFADIGRLPNFRLRMLIRHFARYYVTHCPPGAAQDNVLLPFMNYFSTHLYQRINAKWEALAEQKLQEPVNEVAEREEAVDEVIVLMMQREYMEMLRDVLLGTGGGGEEEMNIEAPPNPAPNRLENLSELGVKIARNKPTSDAILIFLIRCLCYQDTQCSLRTARYLLPLIVQLISDSLLNEEIARLLFSNLLQAFHVHGEHDANQGALLILSVQLYTLLRVQYPCVRDTLLLIPNLNEQDLQKFDEKILAYCSLKSATTNGDLNGCSQSPISPAILADLVNNKQDRTHKDMFRKLVNNIIGKNVGQLFKCRATVKELPRLAPKPRHSPTARDNGAALDDIASLFSNNFS